MWHGGRSGGLRRTGEHGRHSLLIFDVWYHPSQSVVNVIAMSISPISIT
jgi:hypothetical protein